MHDLELGDGGIAHALDLGEPGRRRGHHLGEGAEFGDQLLGQRLDVALRDGSGQHQSEQLTLTTSMVFGSINKLDRKSCNYSSLLPSWPDRSRQGPSGVRSLALAKRVLI